MKLLKEIIDSVFGTETPVKKEIESKTEFVKPPIIESLFDEVKYNQEEYNNNSNIHNRIVWKSQKQKSLYHTS